MILISISRRLYSRDTLSIGSLLVRVQLLQLRLHKHGWIWAQRRGWESDRGKFIRGARRMHHQLDVQKYRHRRTTILYSIAFVLLESYQLHTIFVNGPTSDSALDSTGEGLISLPVTTNTCLRFATSRSLLLLPVDRPAQRSNEPPKELIKLWLDPIIFYMSCKLLAALHLFEVDSVGCRTLEESYRRARDKFWCGPSSGCAYAPRGRTRKRNQTRGWQAKR